MSRTPKPPPTAARLTRTPTMRPVTPRLPGSKPATVPKGRKRKADLVEQVRTAERRLNEVKDENAEWTLARLKSKQKFIDSNDTHYWFAVCCESRAQRNALLDALDIELGADNYQYVSVWTMLRAINLRIEAGKPISLTPDSRGLHTLPVNRRWGRHAMPPGGEADE